MKRPIFDKSFLDNQRKALLEEKKRLEQGLRKISIEKPDIDGDYTAKYQEYGNDDESNAQEYAQTETNVVVVEQLEDELKRVNEALARIDNGTYGLDVKTGKPINVHRLEANPSAQENI